jgi:hypothetical protein
MTAAAVEDVERFPVEKAPLAKEASAFEQLPDEIIEQ